MKLIFALFPHFWTNPYSSPYPGGVLLGRIFTVETVGYENSSPQNLNINKNGTPKKGGTEGTQRGYSQLFEKKCSPQPQAPINDSE